MNQSNFIEDPKIPFLEDALKPDRVEALFDRTLDNLRPDGERIRVKSVKLLRHKVGRRCLIQYDLQILSSQYPDKSIVLLGKIRAKGLDKNTYQLNQSLWQGAFNPRSVDKISVPKPIGVIPQWHMWLQEKVAGVNTTDLLLLDRDDCQLANKIALVAHKLHRANIPINKTHTLADELSILHQRLEKMMTVYPDWHKPLEQILQGCDRLAENFPRFNPQGIHRDFYADQILVAGENLYLLDLDLYCYGDIAVDIGNFIAHLTEKSLRSFNDPDALKTQENTIKNQFLHLAGEQYEKAIEIYRILTLVRHISISTQFPERQPYTPLLIDLCAEYFHNLGYF